jgi:hypothetical protein
MVRHDTEYIYTQGRLPVLYVNTDVEELVIHNPILIHSVEVAIASQNGELEKFCKE